MCLFPAEQFAKSVDGHGLSAADVESHATDGTLCRCYKRIGNIRDVREVAGLIAVTNDRERLASQFLGEEDAKDSSVGA